MPTLFADPECAPAVDATPVSVQQLSVEEVENAVLAQPVCRALFAEEQASPANGWHAKCKELHKVRGFSDCV
jgi:hypothetical protein